MGKIKLKKGTGRESTTSEGFITMSSDELDDAEGGIYVIEDTVSDIDWDEDGESLYNPIPESEYPPDGVREEIVTKQDGPPIKHYEYGFEHPDISQVSNKEEVHDKILEEFSVQLKEWLNG